MSHLTSARLRLSLVIVCLFLAASAAGFTLWKRHAVKAAAPSAATNLPTLRGEAAVEQLKQQG